MLNRILYFYKNLFFLLFIVTLVTVVATLPAPSAVAGDYTIGPGDVLSITVFDHDELAVKVRVSENGNIEFPLIGSVHVGGLKVSGADNKIEHLLADGYIVDPQVTVFIEQFKSKKVIVLGKVKNPGLVELRGSISLLELISQAGGLEKDAGETVVIKREADGAQKIITVDLTDLLESGGAKKNIQILGGDTVSIAQGAVCYITGGVKRPGAYPCGRNTTLLKIISQAGSFTDKAAESDITINRVVHGVKRVLRKINHNTRVLPDDVIEVPENDPKKDLVCYVTGGVKRPGAYPCGRNATVLKMISQAGSFNDKAAKSDITINRMVRGAKRILRKIDYNTRVLPDDVIVVSENTPKKDLVCYVTGQVNRPGAYPCGRTSTVLKMISLAGGFTGIASESGINIKRVVRGRKKVLRKVDIDMLVRPDDVIIVPESFF